MLILDELTTGILNCEYLDNLLCSTIFIEVLFVCLQYHSVNRILNWVAGVFLAAPAFRQWGMELSIP